MSASVFAQPAHKTLGSFPEGSVRFSTGWANTEADIDAALREAAERLVRRGRAVQAAARKYAELSLQPPGRLGVVAVQKANRKHTCPSLGDSCAVQFDVFQAINALQEAF